MLNNAALPRPKMEDCIRGLRLYVLEHGVELHLFKGVAVKLSREEFSAFLKSLFFEEEKFEEFKTVHPDCLNLISGYVNGTFRRLRFLKGHPLKITRRHYNMLKSAVRGTYVHSRPQSDRNYMNAARTMALKSESRMRESQYMIRGTV